MEVHLVSTLKTSLICYYRRGFKIENQQIICAKHEEMPSGTCYICSDISINGLVTKIIRSIEQNTESSSYECMPTTSREANPSVSIVVSIMF